MVSNKQMDFSRSSNLHYITSTYVSIHSITLCSIEFFDNLLSLILIYGYVQEYDHMESNIQTQVPTYTYTPQSIMYVQNLIHKNISSTQQSTDNNQLNYQAQIFKYLTSQLVLKIIFERFILVNMYINSPIIIS